MHTFGERSRISFFYLLIVFLRYYPSFHHTPRPLSLTRVSVHSFDRSFDCRGSSKRSRSAVPALPSSSHAPHSLLETIFLIRQTVDSSLHFLPFFFSFLYLWNVSLFGRLVAEPTGNNEPRPFPVTRCFSGKILIE